MAALLLPQEETLLRFPAGSESSTHLCSVTLSREGQARGHPQPSRARKSLHSSMVGSA